MHIKVLKVFLFRVGTKFATKPFLDLILNHRFQVSAPMGGDCMKRGFSEGSTELKYNTIQYNAFDKLLLR